MMSTFASILTGIGIGLATSVTAWLLTLLFLAPRVQIEGLDAGEGDAAWPAYQSRVASRRLRNLIDVEVRCNPLLVELKRSLTRGAVDQALYALNAHPTARLALLVYLEPSPGEQPPSRDELNQARFPVLVISLQQLLRRMTSASFAEVVRDMRNRSSHGLGPS